VSVVKKISRGEQKNIPQKRESGEEDAGTKILRVMEVFASAADKARKTQSRLVGSR
jgi:hypothetical protein